jgi:TPP-dependent pyruvate/acetoin dehydrogenase alpha subunit
LEEWLPRDPIPGLRRRIADAGGSLDSLDRMEQEIQMDLEAAVRFARDSPVPDPGELLQYVYGPRR